MCWMSGFGKFAWIQDTSMAHNGLVLPEHVLWKKGCYQESRFVYIGRRIHSAGQGTFILNASLWTVFGSMVVGSARELSHFPSSRPKCCWDPMLLSKHRVLCEYSCFPLVFTSRPALLGCPSYHLDLPVCTVALCWHAEVHISTETHWIDRHNLTHIT